MKTFGRVVHKFSTNTPTNSIAPNETPINKKKRNIFVPDNETSKKVKTKENVDSVLTTLTATINDIKESLSNDNSNELLKLLKKESAKQARRDETFLNLISAMVNNNQMQQGPSIPFVSCSYGSQSIRNLTKVPVPSTLVPSQQQNQRYLHSLGHSIIGMV